MYCIWIIFDDTHNLEWFIALRATITVCWFAAKVALMWLFNGRLFYVFINSPLQLPRSSFIALNSFITIVTPLCIILGYVGVWNGLSWMIVLGFQGFRVIYVLTATLLLCMFSNRLLHLQKLVIQNAEKKINAETNVQQQNLLDVTTKNGVLTLFMVLSALFVAASWLVHDYAFPQSYLTLLIPFLMFAIDSVLSSFCVFLLFGFSEHLYAKVCRKSDRCCRHLYVRTELRMIADRLSPQRTAPPHADSEKTTGDTSTVNVSSNLSTHDSAVASNQTHSSEVIIT
eukprot:310094_1